MFTNFMRGAYQYAASIVRPATAACASGTAQAMEAGTAAVGEAAQALGFKETLKGCCRYIASGVSATLGFLKNLIFHPYQSLKNLGSGLANLWSKLWEKIPFFGPRAA